MKKKRLIPILLLRNGWLVQSKGFNKFQNLGNPISAVKRLSEWASDELIYLDISCEEHYDMRRDDIRHPNRNNILEIIEDVSKVAFMPITVGGKIRTLKDIEMRLLRGADKIAINTRPLEERSFIEEAAKEFGSQCVVVSMDVKTIDEKYFVMSSGGKNNTGYHPVEWAKISEGCGSGEILVNSIDQDGMKTGFDISLMKRVSEAVNIPVIACGGAGAWNHFANVLQETKVDAVAAANIFQHIDQSVYLAKKYLYENNFQVRPPDLMFIE